MAFALRDGTETVQGVERFLDDGLRTPEHLTRAGRWTAMRQVAERLYSSGQSSTQVASVMVPSKPLPDAS